MWPSVYMFYSGTCSWCVVSARFLVVHVSEFCSSPLVVARLSRGFNLFLAPGSSVAGSQLQMRVGQKFFGFVNQVLLTSVVARAVSSSVGVKI